MARSVLLAALLLSLWTAGARAARFEVQPSVNGSWIFVQGEFALDDGPRFERLLSANPDAPMVVLESSGGKLVGGIDVGAAIHARGLATLVMNGTTCASACALAWLGGAKRYMAANARIGFHAAYVGAGTQTGQVSGGGNAVVGAYLSRLGLSDRAVFYVTNTAPARVSWLSLADARALGIDVLPYDTTAVLPAAQRSQDSGNGTPAAGRLQMEDAARRFPFSYYAQSAEAPVIAEGYFETVYAEEVNLNGQVLARARLLEAKRAAMKKWPEQEFAVRPESVRVKCDPLAYSCEVSGIVDWQWSSWGRGARAAGDSGFWFKLVFDGETTLVAGEAETVLQRESSGPE